MNRREMLLGTLSLALIPFVPKEKKFYTSELVYSVGDMGTYLDESEMRAHYMIMEKMHEKR